MIPVGYTDRKICALSSAGKKLWEANTGYAGSDIYPGPNGDCYYTYRDETKPDSTQVLYALKSDGSKKWELNTGGYIKDITFDKDGLMLISLSTKKIIYIDPKDGSKKSEIACDAVPGKLVIGADGTIYTAATGVKELGKDNDGYMRISEYGLLLAYTSDGTKKWELNFGASLFGLNMTPDGMLVASSDNHVIVKVDTSGVKKQEYLMSGYSTADPTIGSDGSIYAFDSENKIYSFGK
jgi:sugar lactone lactonase YvrE